MDQTTNGLSVPSPYPVYDSQATHEGHSQEQQHQQSSTSTHQNGYRNREHQREDAQMGSNTESQQLHQSAGPGTLSPSGLPAIVAGESTASSMHDMGEDSYVGEVNSNGAYNVEAYDLHTNAVDPYWKWGGEAKWEGGRPAFVDPAKKMTRQSSYNLFGKQVSIGKLSTSVQDGATTVAGSEGEVEPAATPYQDVWATFLFIAHLAIIFWLAFDWGLPLLEKDVDARDNAMQADVQSVQNSSLVALTTGGTVCTLGAAVLSYLTLKCVLHHARALIRGALIATIAVQIVVAVAAMLASQLWLFILSCIFAALGLCYYRLVRNRIAFASENLHVATQAIGHASGPVLVSFLVVFCQLVWQFVWTLALVGALLPQKGFTVTQGGNTYGEFECETDFSYLHDSYVCVCSHNGAEEGETTTALGRCHVSSGPGFILFLLLVSMFWGSVVLQYIVHCTTSGVVAEWWFTGVRQGTTWPSFKRAVTTSFGSICFGALFLSIIRAAHQVLLEMQKSKNNACTCVASCLLRLVDSIATYFNRYAFTYVAMYGTSFVESGRDVFALFKSKGLTVLINDQLVSNVFTFLSFGAAVLIALVGYGFAMAFGLDGGYKAVLAGVGFVVGLLVCAIVLSIVDSAVATVFVCWADAKDVLQKNAPELYAGMDKAWSEAMAATEL